MAFQELHKSSVNFITRYRRFHCCCGKRIKCSDGVAARIELLDDNLIKEPIIFKTFEFKYKWRRVNNTKANFDHIYRLPFYYISDRMIYVLICNHTCQNFRLVIDNFNNNHITARIGDEEHQNPIYN